MNRIAHSVRARREIARTRREVRRAIDGAASPSMRDELITMAQAQDLALH